MPFFSVFGSPILKSQVAKLKGWGSFVLSTYVTINCCTLSPFLDALMELQTSVTPRPRPEAVTLALLSQGW